MVKTKHQPPKVDRSKARFQQSRPSAAWKLVDGDPKRSHQLYYKKGPILICVPNIWYNQRACDRVGVYLFSYETHMKNMRYHLSQNDPYSARQSGEVATRCLVLECRHRAMAKDNPDAKPLA